MTKRVMTGEDEDDAQGKKNSAQVSFYIIIIIGTIYFFVFINLSSMTTQQH